VGKIFKRRLLIGPVLQFHNGEIHETS
jgi:hypothetical protein